MRQLPGQPKQMHLGTKDLIDDLLAEVRRLRTKALEAELEATALRENAAQTRTVMAGGLMTGAPSERGAHAVHVPVTSMSQATTTACVCSASPRPASPRKGACYGCHSPSMTAHGYLLSP